MCVNERMNQKYHTYMYVCERVTSRIYKYMYDMGGYD